MSDTTAAGLTEAEREALWGVDADIETFAVVERILGARLAAVQAERERRVTENDSEFLMRALTPDQWKVIARKIRAEVEPVEAERDRWRQYAEERWDQLTVENSRRHAAEAERDAARAEVEALRGRVGALADDWAEAGPSLVRNAYDGSNVTEGQTFERCAAAVRAALDADR